MGRRKHAGMVDLLDLGVVVFISNPESQVRKESQKFLGYVVVKAGTFEV